MIISTVESSFTFYHSSQSSNHVYNAYDSYITVIVFMDLRFEHVLSLLVLSVLLLKVAFAGHVLLSF